MAAVGPARPRVLCLDGGGIRGLSEILILKELMLQVRIQNNLDYTPEPKQCFDFICGTSTGGLLAVLLGRLGKTLNECEDLFRSFGSKIFSGGTVSRTLRMISTGSKHTSEGLSTVIRAQASNEKMHEVDGFTQGHIPVAVIAVSKTTRDDYLFRTYGTRASMEACPIVDACLATSAATTFFPSIEIDGVEYVDGAFRKNNPSSAALAELESAEWISPMQDAVSEVGCLVSVGTGRGTFDREVSSAISKIIPRGLISLKEAAKICVKIATDCHEAHLDVEKRFRRMGLNESYHRFDVEIGLESVMLNESDDKALQHITSVTKGYLKSCQHELEGCARFISPRGTTRSDNVTVNQLPNFGMFSSLPECTDMFLGREEELLELGKSLDPSIPGRKSALLHGIGGSGKTQLALQHIRREARRYSAVIWINISTPAIAIGSVTEAAITMADKWPRDIPVLSGQRESDNLAYVKSRLRTTGYRNWLLVIDSADDQDHDDLATYIPGCEFGSVLVTSTTYRHCSWFRPRNPIHLGGLDQQNSYSLLLRSAGRCEDGEDTPAMKTIIKELSGIPLAIEQAGGLICNAEFTFNEFLTAYQKQYRSLMRLLPDEGLWSYEKNRAMITILDMTCRSLETNPEHVLLLHFLGVLGSWQVPVSLLDTFEFFDMESVLPPSLQGLRNLRSILREPHKLRLALRKLASFCLIRIKQEHDHLVSFMIHGILCQWSLDRLSEPERQDIIMQSAYGLAKAACQPRRQTNILAEDRLDDQFEMIQQTYFAPLKHQLSLVTQHITEVEPYPFAAWYRTPYAIILRQAAWAHLAQGLPNEAKDFFEQSFGFESSETGAGWPEDKSRIEILSGYSKACFRTGCLEPAVESLKSAERLSERIYGTESEITLKIVSRLKEIYERQDRMPQYARSTVLASATTSQGQSPTEKSPGPSGNGQNIFQGHRRGYEENELGYDVFDACQSGDDVKIREILGSTGIRRAEETGVLEMLLVTAVSNGHRHIVELLFEHDATLESVNAVGLRSMAQTTKDAGFRRHLLGIATRSGHWHMVKFLIDNGAGLEHSNAYGGTILAESAQDGHVDAVKILLELGADGNHRDEEGHTPLAIAARSGHLYTVDLLLKKGAEVDCENQRGNTPLAIAAWNGYFRTAQRLIEHGADIDHKDVSGRTPLANAARNGHFRTVKLLLKRNAFLDSRDDEGRTALGESAAQGHVNILKLLLGQGADAYRVEGPGRSVFDPEHWTGKQDVLPYLARWSLKVRGPFGRTVFHLAARNGTIWPAKWYPSWLTILKIGVNVQDDLGNTPLHEACQLSDADGVAALADAGARCDIKNKDGRTPVDIARIWHRDSSLGILTSAEEYEESKLTWRDMSIAEIVISQPLDILKSKTRKASLGDLNAFSALYGTPLGQALRRGPKFVKHLLKLGSDPNGVDHHNQTPLFIAVSKDDINSLGTLVAHGADVNQSCDGHDSLWEYVARRGSWETVFKLLELDAHINPKSICIHTALMHAARAGNLVVCKRLVNAGASIRYKYANPMDALWSARVAKQIHVLEFFASVDDRILQESPWLGMATWKQIPWRIAFKCVRLRHRRVGTHCVSFCGIYIWKREYNGVWPRISSEGTECEQEDVMACHYFLT